MIGTRFRTRAAARPARPRSLRLAGLAAWLIAATTLAGGCSENKDSSAEFFNADSAANEAEAALDQSARNAPSAQRESAPAAAQQGQAGGQMQPGGQTQPGGVDGELNSVFSGANLGRLQLKPFENAEDRILEYQLHLVYRTDNFLEKRRALYALAGRYGFLQQANASADSASMTTTFRVASNKIFPLLDELDALGKLENESINVVDHTEALFRAQRRIAREQARAARRAQGPQTARTWAEKEQLISASEDAEDAETLNRWRTLDNAHWATVSVTLLGPDVPDQVQVPAYRNAFVFLANFLLELAYYLILWAPAWLAALVVWFKRGVFIRAYQRRSTRNTSGL